MTRIHQLVTMAGEANKPMGCRCSAIGEVWPVAGCWLAENNRHGKDALSRCQQGIPAGYR